LVASEGVSDPARPLQMAGALLAVLAPLGIVMLLGASSASLWLDEITYYRLQDDVALRAAEIGRPGSAAAPWFSNFFYGDIQRSFQQPFVALGLLDPLRQPEVLVRALSVVSYAAAVILILAWCLRRGADLRAAALGSFLFAGAPLFLYYAFEGRVYAFASLAVVALLVAVERASRAGGRRDVFLAAFLGALAAHLQLWTVCLFAALFLFGAAETLRRGRATPRARALLAASVPALVVVGVEFGLMKATQPADPLFRFFEKQPLLPTLASTATSIFRGPLQVQNVFREPATDVLVAGCLVLLAVLAVRTCLVHEDEGVFGARGAARAAVLSLVLSVALAATFGHFAHGRYQAPLVAALFYALARGLSGRRALFLALLLAVTESALLPSTAAAIQAKSNSRAIAALVLEGTSRHSAAVIVQHGVVSGYPAPHHSIGLDFYLNDLHPGEDAIPVFELPDLRRVNGDHGTYRYFNGGEALVARTLKLEPERLRAWAAREAPTDLWLVFTLWPVEPSRRQAAEVLDLLAGASGYGIAGRFVVPGYPRAEVVHLRRTGNRGSARDA
jgi:hypothetical protein